MAPQQAASERTPLLRPNGSEEAGVVSDINTNGHSARTGDDEEEERTIIADELPLLHLTLIFSASFTGILLGAIDSTIIATLTGPISSEFDSMALMSWLSSAYFIANAACQPISGRLTDIFGRGPGLVFSNIFFALGNLICGLSKDQTTMIFGRVVAGIGGGGLMSIATFLASDLIPLRKRGVIQGIGNIFFSTGAMVGGVFGGFMNDHTKMGWRLAFLIQVPPSLICAVAAALLVKVPPKQSDKSYLSRIDFGGVFFIVLFLMLLITGLNSGGNLVPWNHPLPLTTIPLSVVAFATFIWWESRAKQPIVPVRLVMQRTVLAACLTNFFSTMVTMSGLFYVPLFLQIRGVSATAAGLYLLPSPLGASVGSIVSGIYMRKTGRYWGFGVVMLIVYLGGMGTFVTMDDKSPLWLSSVGFFFAGTGYGTMLTVTLLGCIAAVDHSQQAVATGATCKYKPQHSAGASLTLQ